MNNKPKLIASESLKEIMLRGTMVSGTSDSMIVPPEGLWAGILWCFRRSLR